jgi:hypothetical protein
MFLESPYSRNHRAQSIVLDQALYADGTDTETAKIKEWVESGRVADLARLQCQSPEAVARLCLQMAISHPQEVTVLLWHADVAQSAFCLLKPTGSNEEEGASIHGLAQCLLNAGHSLHLLPEFTSFLPTVKNLLRERQSAYVDYWSSRPKVRRKHLWQAFLYSNEAYSDQCVNGKIVAQQGSSIENLTDDRVLTFCCRHFAQAMRISGKEFLKKISRGDTSGLDYDALECAHIVSQLERGNRSVQFDAPSFGRLLVRVVAQLSPGQTASYSVGFLNSKSDGRGHEMRLIVKKDAPDHLGRQYPDHLNLKIYLYDPNITGNARHLRVLPEHLSQLSFEDFVCPGVDIDLDWGVDVLSLELDDPDLAHALAGQFVSRNVQLQISSYINALASGNCNEMRASFKVLTREDFENLNNRRHGFQLALRSALVTRYFEAAREVRHTGLLDVLDQTSIEGIATLKEGGLPLLAWALKYSQFAMATAFSEILAAISHRLPSQLLREVLEAKHLYTVCGQAENVPCLHWAMMERRTKAVGILLGTFGQLKGALGEDAMLRLLVCEDANGRSGVAGALATGCHETLAAFTSGYVACGLSTGALDSLLLCVGSQLGNAIDKGHGKVVGQFLNMVRTALHPQALSRISKAGARELERIFVLASRQPSSCFPCIWTNKHSFRRLLRQCPDLETSMRKVLPELKALAER